MSTGKPLHSVRAGGIQIAVWQNDTAKGPMNSITIDKSYKDAKGEWQRTKNFKDSDLPKIVLGLNEVMRFLFLKDDKGSESKETITPKDF